MKKDATIQEIHAQLLRRLREAMDDVYAVHGDLDFTDKIAYRNFKAELQKAEDVIFDLKRIWHGLGDETPLEDGSLCLHDWQGLADGFVCGRCGVQGEVGEDGSIYGFNFICRACAHAFSTAVNGGTCPHCEHKHEDIVL